MQTRESRSFAACAATFLLGLLIGAGALYFLVIRDQTQMIHQLYAASLTDRVIIAARLRAGMEQRVLADSDQLIGQSVAGVREIAGDTEPARQALQIARAYYDFHGVPIPAAAESVLAQIEPASKASFEALRNHQVSDRK